jgi:hypothetical protein
MPNYKESKIYKIINDDNDDIYIGSTTQKLSQRYAEHAREYKRYLLDNKRYVSSYEILRNNNSNIILIENFECDNREELLKKERYYIDSIKCVNKNRPYVAEGEDKETKNGQMKVYYQDNKEKIKLQMQEHYQENKDNKQEYQRINKDKIKEYQKANRDKINQQRRDNYKTKKNIEIEK